MINSWRRRWDECRHANFSLSTCTNTMSLIDVRNYMFLSPISFCKLPWLMQGGCIQFLLIALGNVTSDLKWEDNTQVLTQTFQPQHQALFVSLGNQEADAKWLEYILHQLFESFNTLSMFFFTKEQFVFQHESTWTVEKTCSVWMRWCEESCDSSQFTDCVWFR